MDSSQRQYVSSILNKFTLIALTVFPVLVLFGVLLDRYPCTSIAILLVGATIVAAQLKARHNELDRRARHDNHRVAVVQEGENERRLRQKCHDTIERYAFVYEREFNKEKRRLEWQKRFSAESINFFATSTAEKATVNMVDGLRWASDTLNNLDNKRCTW